MKKLFIFCLAIITLSSCNSSKKAMQATKNEKGNLVGIATKEDFQQAPYNTWFTENYKDTEFNQDVVNELKNHINGVKIKGFMGTWCGDSKRETPAFYKLLEAVNFNMKNLEFATVNRKKKTTFDLEKDLDIIRVPTFIFYKNGKEIGRYVEYAQESMEEDFLKIISGKPYKHSYE